MKQEILNGTFKSSSIDSIIDKDLSAMFNPKVNVSDETKAEIKKRAQALSPHFIAIVDNYNTAELDESYVDDLFEAIDKFALAFEQTLNSIPDRYISTSVGVIWSGMFATLSHEFKNTPDSLAFLCGKDKMLDIVMKKVKK